MAVPKRRTNSSKRNMRRSHHWKSPMKFATCAKCKSAILPHTACPNCGTYKGRVVIDVMKGVDKKKSRDTAKTHNHE